MGRTIIDIEGTPLRVQEARRMLTNWNKMVRGETISGVYRMRAKDIQEVMKDFTIKNGMVKHKTKAKGWSFNPATLQAKTGKLITSIPKYEGKKIMKKEMPKPASVPVVKKKKKRKLVIVDKLPSQEEKSTPTPMKTEMPKKRRGRPQKIV
jgi:plastocyanin